MTSVPNIQYNIQPNDPIPYVEQLADNDWVELDQIMDNNLVDAVMIFEQSQQLVLTTSTDKLPTSRTINI